MGNYFQHIVVPDAPASHAQPLGERVLAWLVEREIVLADATDCVSDGVGYSPGPNYARATTEPWAALLETIPNGMKVVAQRTVFWCVSNDLQIVCPACGERFEAMDDAWNDAVGEWYERTGPGELACPGCGVSRPINQWPHDPTFGFADLGFTFWNWPPLSDEFVAAVAEKVGHRVFVIADKF